MCQIDRNMFTAQNDVELSEDGITFHFERHNLASTLEGLIERHQKIEEPPSVSLKVTQLAEIVLEKYVNCDSKEQVSAAESTSFMV